jgi:putative membrane-bound dehydrogenase-like protein
MSSMTLNLLVAVVLAAEPAAPAVPPGMHAVKLNGHTFTLPVGFEIELIANGPLTQRPIHIDFDEQGRLYIAESSGLTERADIQLQKSPHTVLRLEDTNGDGKFDRRTVFAERLMLPEGMMFYEGSVYVAAPPSIWKFTDKDGDGVSDERSEWFQGKTLTGCANDLHGPYLGLDGRIYWCKGAFAEQTYERPGKPPFVTKASHIFRARPDGTGIEHVMTGGMDNPVEVAFTLGGERIFTTTFLTQPGGGLRDGLIHAVYGGVYGKIQAVIEDHKRTGEILQPMSHLGPAVPAGLTTYESRVFGDDYQGNLFACLFNLHKISRHVLEPEGGTFKATDLDFLVSDNIDFHPTDVLEDADGSLIVVDTGGWYKICCPSSQMAKDDIPGAIYRVRRTGAKKIDDPRGLKLAWDTMSPEQMARLLADERTAVRKRAMHELGKKGSAALDAVAKVASESPSAAARRFAVWTLTRIDDPAARVAVRAALKDKDQLVRQAALHSISLHVDADAAPMLLQILSRGTPHNRRVAAEALGRIGNPAAVPVLLSVAGEELDRYMEHALTYALIDIANPQETRAGLQSANARTRRSALIAMDQMDGGGLEPMAVAPLLAATDPVLKETATWLVSRHPDWGGALTGFLKERLAAKEMPADDAAELAGQLGRFAKDGTIQQLLGDHLADAKASAASRQVVLSAMAQSGLKEMPANWAGPLAAMLRSGGADQTAAAVKAVRSIPAVKEGAADLRFALLLVATSERHPGPVRLEALAAVPGGLSGVEDNVFDYVRAHLSPDTPVTTRLAAAEILSKARLNSEQLVRLTESVQSAGPLEIERLLGAFAQSKSDDVGLKLTAALKQAVALANLRQDVLQKLFEKYSPAVKQQAEEVYQAMAQATAQQRAKLEQLLANVPAGDVRRGQLVFHSQKAACNTCHAMGYLGGKIGPDLTRIGSVRTEKDLLESIVFPSATFVRSYEPLTVLTKSGKAYSGVLKSDGAQEIVLTINAKDEARIPRDEIEEMQPAAVSIMPAGLDQQLTPQELADLVAFLRASK